VLLVVRFVTEIEESDAETSSLKTKETPFGEASNENAGDEATGGVRSIVGAV
jgi:hypothetical protein